MTSLSFPPGPAPPPGGGRRRRSRARPECRGRGDLLRLPRADDPVGSGAPTGGELEAVAGVEVQQEQTLDGDGEAVAAAPPAGREPDPGGDVADVQQGVRARDEGHPAGSGGRVGARLATAAPRAPTGDGAIGQPPGERRPAGVTESPLAVTPADPPHRDAGTGAP